MGIKTAVITGSAGGIGGGLAQAFYRRGFNVVISDVNQQLLAQRIDSIAGSNADGRMLAQPCDVTDQEQVQSLWHAASERYGNIDYWVNNAGLGGTQKSIHESDIDTLMNIVDVNIKGVMIGTHIAVNGMLKQGGGRIYNTAGMGENGFTRPTMVSYGTTKRAVGYFSNGVAKEIEGSGVTIGWLNPGMVITPMVINDAKAMGEQRWKKEGRVMFRLFGTSPEATGEELVKRILADSHNGTFIKLLTTPKMLAGFIFGWFGKDKLVPYGI
ncbi:SDR family oxidoreductase [Oceanicoccus sp. KOV_DT_Chl]|uniref:SDR family NAD(P)-dependent oxidoreductase n=1 Tax=Oceanicoccus sp. KOV_DT_Chl TaxID=1904639 RepID=UPI000C7C7C67|nr:SDR family oxidoreductase [Oceanicoccus sp. KOV_DT_Chl]